MPPLRRISTYLASKRILPLEGAFVRALENVWHLNCFKCKVSFIWYNKKESLIASKDCDTVTASSSSFLSMVLMADKFHYVNETISDG